MTREEAIRKAAALLRLAQSNNPNEAATAAAHAQALMYRAGIDEAALELDGAGQPRGEIVDSGAAGAPLDPDGRASWRGRLAVIITRANGCHCYKSAGALHIIGRAASMEAARYLYAAIAADVARLTDRHGAGLGRTWRNNFANGAVETVSRRLREQHEATMREVRAEAVADLFEDAARRTALVRVERAIVKVADEAREVAAWGRVNLRLRSGGGSGGRYDASAREQGRAAGRGIALGGARAVLGAGRRQIGGGS